MADDCDIRTMLPLLTPSDSRAMTADARHSTAAKSRCESIGYVHRHTGAKAADGRTSAAIPKSPGRRL